MGQPSDDTADGTRADVHGCGNASFGRSDDVVLLEGDDSGSVTLCAHDGEECSEESNSDTWSRHNQCQTGDTEASLCDNKPDTFLESIGEVRTTPEKSQSGNIRWSTENNGIR